MFSQLVDFVKELFFARILLVFFGEDAVCHRTLGNGCMDTAADMTDAYIDAPTLGARGHHCFLSASLYTTGVLRVREWRKDWLIAGYALLR